MPNIEFLRSDHTPVSDLPFGPAVCYDDLILVSDQSSIDNAANIISSTFVKEFRHAIENLIQILHDAGSVLAHLIQTRNYGLDPAHGALFQEPYKEYFKPPYPVRTIITNFLPPSLHHEIDCVAVGEARPSDSSGT